MKLYRVIPSLILSVLLVISSLSPAMATRNSPAFTPQDYVAYLTARGEVEPEALKIRKQFLKLSSKDQQQFIDYMSNPKIMEEMFNTPVSENSKKELHNGDIVIEHKTETEIVSETEPKEEKKLLSSLTALFCGSCFATPSVKTIRLTDYRTIKICGSNVGHFTAWVLYTVKGNTVVSVNDGNGSYAGWWPVIIEKESVSKYIHGNKAQTCVVWNRKPPVIGNVSFGFSWVVTFHHDVIGNASGGKSHRFYQIGV